VLRFRIDLNQFSKLSGEIFDQNLLKLKWTPVVGRKAAIAKV